MADYIPTYRYTLNYKDDGKIIFDEYFDRSLTKEDLENVLKSKGKGFQHIYVISCDSNSIRGYVAFYEMVSSYEGILLTAYKPKKVAVLKRYEFVGRQQYIPITVVDSITKGEF